MERKVSTFVFGIMPGAFLALAFLYILFIIRPLLYVHHLQPPFLFSADFLAPYLASPGGLSEYAANLFMQPFHHWLLGPVVFFGIAWVLYRLTFLLMNRVYRSRWNAILALLPLVLTLPLANHYNLPFSVLVSLAFVLLCAWLLAACGRTLPGRMAWYAGGALMTYYFAGSGYLVLFSAVSLFFTVRPKSWSTLPALALILATAILLPWIAYKFIFPLPGGNIHFWFYPARSYFIDYEPSPVFYLSLFSVPALLGIAALLSAFEKVRRLQQDGSPQLAAALLWVPVFTVSLLSHLSCFQGDARKIVASDYYCYHRQPARTAKAALSLKEYSFAANLNYNLAMGRAGTLTEAFFNFFQVAGTDALHPDVEFSTELSFISADFYYELGYISEARHWAYESLVHYPHSPRALQLLVKIHLVTGEYRAAERCLNILRKGWVGRKLVREYAPCVRDTALVSSLPEIMEKRSMVPAGKELTPFIDHRFRELLGANDQNRLAYECLMLYYLLEGQLDNFMELYGQAGNYFDRPIGIYEEAILMYGEKNRVAVTETYTISAPSIARFKEFNDTLSHYAGNEKLARNVLYWQMGKTYLYYLRFVLPRIVKPEIIREEYEEAPI